MPVKGSTLCTVVEFIDNPLTAYEKFQPAAAAECCPSELTAITAPT